MLQKVSLLCHLEKKQKPFMWRLVCIRLICYLITLHVNSQKNQS